MHDEDEHSPAEAAWQDQWSDQEEAAGPEEALLEEAWNKLDAGDATGALSCLLQLDEDWPDRWIPEALARMELGELRKAKAVLQQAADFEDLESHPDYLWARALLSLGEWRFGAARADLEKLVALEPSAGAYERLSLVHDLEGDLEGADRHMAQTIELDPGKRPVARLSPEEFEAEVLLAVQALPRQFQDALEGCEILIDPVPSPWMMEPTNPAATPPDLLGLFLGASRLESAENETAELSPRIFLFQRNIERAAHTTEELREEIRATLYHEIGHLLGFDEEGVADMGLE
jgi:predicted Zn-dependent protease with MMP-like domain